MAINAAALAEHFVDKLPEFRGDLISSLTGSVERAEGAGVPNPGSVAAPLNSRRKAALPHSPDACDYIILKALPAGSELPCATVDCKRQAVLFLDSRDGELQPCCAKCAYVEFAMWMAGGRMSHPRCISPVKRKKRREQCGEFGSEYRVKGNSYEVTAVLCVKHKQAVENEGFTVTAVRA